MDSAPNLVCRGCGDGTNLPGSRFCRSCGAAFGAPSAPVARMVAPPPQATPAGGSMLPIVLAGVGCLLLLGLLFGGVIFAGFTFQRKVVAQQQAARARLEEARKAEERERAAFEESQKLQICESAEDVERLLPTLTDAGVREAAKRRLEELVRERDKAKKAADDAAKAAADEARLFEAFLQGGDAQARAYLEAVAPGGKEAPATAEEGETETKPLSLRARAASVWLDRHADAPPGPALDALAAALESDADEDRKAFGGLIRAARASTPPRLVAHLARTGGTEAHEESAKKCVEDAFAAIRIAVAWIAADEQAAVHVTLTVDEDEQLVFGEEKIHGEKANVALAAGEWSKISYTATPMTIRIRGAVVTLEDIRAATAEQIAALRLLPW